MKKRPLLMVRWGPALEYGAQWQLRRQFVIVIILAPFPPEEQTPGGYVEALVNAKISFRLRWPFVSCEIYAPDRWANFFARDRHDR